MPAISYADSADRQESISGAETSQGRLYVNLTLNIRKPGSIEELREQLAASDDAVQAVADHLGLGFSEASYEAPDASGYAEAKAAVEALSGFFDNGN